jgi:hypothetical protein
MPSTVIDAIEYDPAVQTLKISNVSGQMYQYKAVPEKVYKELKASRVKGRYIRFFIKDRYDFERIT